MTIQEVFALLKDLSQKYCLIEGGGEIVKSSDGTYHFDRSNFGFSIGCGFMDEDLTLQAIDEYECQVQEGGHYDFVALLSYCPAQIGNYPPPNVEVPEYMMLEIMEYLNTPNQ